MIEACVGVGKFAIVETIVTSFEYFIARLFIEDTGIGFQQKRNRVIINRGS